MLQCGRLGAAHVPILFGIIFVINLGCTYCFSVWHGDVDPVFPYVSAAGDNRPESCVFSLLLNVCSVLSMLIVYLRFSLIDTLIRQSDVMVDRVNKVALIFGELGGLGMMVVANFQETAVIAVHLSAACVCFGGGCVYMWLQSWITVHMHPLYANRRIGIYRTLISLFSTVAFFMALGFGVYAAHVFHEYHPDLPTPRPWNSKANQPGYGFHVISAISEWIMALLHISFILSYARDFEKIRVTLTVESLVAHLDHSPLYRSVNDLLYA